jgi:hypothetical protein
MIDNKSWTYQQNVWPPFLSLPDGGPTVKIRKVENTGKKERNWLFSLSENVSLAPITVENLHNITEQ